VATWRSSPCAFNVVLSVLGVLVAFPMKRRFINDEQHAFPEGRACGVVLDTLYTSSAALGLFKAKALAISAAVAGFVTFISGGAYMKLIQEKWLGFASSWHLPHNLDDWYYKLAEKGYVPIPRLANVDLRQLALSPALDLAMFGAGGLMGMRTAASMLLGVFVNFVIVTPWMISIGEIVPKSGSLAAGSGSETTSASTEAAIEPDPGPVRPVSSSASPADGSASDAAEDGIGSEEPEDASGCGPASGPAT